MADGVSPDTCAANRAGLQRGIDHNAAEIGRVDRTTEKRLDAHAHDIDEIKDTMNTLAATQQVIASTQEKLADMQRQHDQRLRVLEDAREKKVAAAAARRWWETDIGKFSIKAAVIGFLVILLAALGHGIDGMGALFGALPK